MTNHMIKDVVGVFSIMAAHFVRSCCACVSRTLRNGTVHPANRRLQLPEDGLCKPEHVAANIIILNTLRI